MSRPVELPAFEPMLATRWPQAFSHPDWAFEVKWDGIRALIAWNGRETRISSRTGRPIGPAYPELQRLPGLPPCILDGEIVAFGEDGRPSFGLLQQRGSRPVPIQFMAFDLLYLESPLVEKRWAERRTALDQLELPPAFTVPAPVLEDGRALWAGIVEQGLEGMVGKRIDSAYRPGTRSPSWRKVARVEQVRAVVGGFLPGERGRGATFGSLLLGLEDGGRLRYVGSVGTGFSTRDLHAIRGALDEMITATSPFGDDTDVPGGAVFVQPGLVALVEYKEWTRAGKLRAPSFKGFTDDLWEAVTWTAEGPAER